MKLLSIALFAVTIVAQEWQIPLTNQKPRVAVIGAGAAGSSVTYFLRKHGIPDVTVFEQGSRAGGRATIINLELPVCENDGINLTNLEVCTTKNVKVEAGASIVARVNQILVNATKDFNLTENIKDASKRGGLGIWNGSEWKFRQESSWIGSLLSNIKFLWRYGVWNGPIQATKIARDVAERFNRLYEFLLQGKAFTDVADIIEALSLHDVTQASCNDFLNSKGISQLFIDEFVAGISRVTYLQNIREISAFGSLISLFSATNEMFSVDGGNFQIFQRMIHDAKTVNWNQTVSSVTLNGSEYVVQTESGLEDTFDVVVVAVPNAFERIKFVNVDMTPPAKAEYVKLYVTFVYGELDPLFFGLESQQDLPSMIFSSDETPASFPFYCLSIQDFNSTHVLTKSFSRAPISEKDLERMFKSRFGTWRHNWDSPGSYPFLRVKQPGWRSPIKVGPGLFFVNAFEPWISTMETEAMAAMNVVNLIRQEL